MLTDTLRPNSLEAAGKVSQQQEQDRCNHNIQNITPRRPCASYIHHTTSDYITLTGGFDVAIPQS